MREVTLQELKQIVANSFQGLNDSAYNQGRCIKIYDHWSAGHYGQFFDDYHINIDSDGSIHLSCEDLSEVLAHTYHRNSGAVGIALACCVGANTNGLGNEPPTNEQLEMLYQVNAVVLKELYLPADKEHLMTHGEAADNEDGLVLSDPYGPNSTVERWDLEYLGTKESPSYNPASKNGDRGGDIIRGKTEYYLQKMS